jgi:molecular chaperone GrpE
MADEQPTDTEAIHYTADPDDPELNPDVERASEIDDVTGPVPRVDEVTEADDVAADVDPELASVLAERDEYRALAQRVQADFENFRKRAATQSLAEADRATGRIVEALLPVLDAAEAAYVQHPDEVGPLLNAMLGELRKHGLETLDLEGKPFDPEVAESVAHEPADGGDLVVADVLRSGYRWKGRTLRPAMVRTRD